MPSRLGARSVARLVILAGVGLLLLLVLRAGSAAAVPAAYGAPAATATPTPLPCGVGLWYQIQPAPAPLVGPASVGLGGQIYVFGTDESNFIPYAYHYDSAADIWTTLAPPPSGRDFSSAVTDGHYIYILNGYTPSGASASLVRYDPAANSYATLAAPATATGEQAAVYLNGRIYRIAGSTGYGSGRTATVEVYTVATDQWSTAADYPDAVGGLVAVATSGRIAAGGGSPESGDDSPKTYQYDPATNQWDDAALPDLDQGRHDAATGVLHGRWLVAGGTETSADTRSTFALDLAHPAAGWTRLADLEALPAMPGGATTADAFYVLGGDRNVPTSAERYLEGSCGPGTPSPTPTACTTGSWTAGAPVPTPVGAAAAAAVGGRIYLFGGHSDANEALDSAYAYIPAGDSWQALAPLPDARYNASAVSDGTYVYILNGDSANTGEQNTLWRYDPQTNTYATLAPAPQASAAQAVALLDGRIYRIAGFGSGGLATDSVDAYTIATNSWAPAGTIAPYPQAAGGVSAVGAHGALWAGGGGFPQSAKTYRYDPVRNIWNDGAIRDLPDGRAFSAGALLGDRWILSGGELYTESPTANTVALDLTAPTGLWQTLAPLPYARSQPAGAADGQHFYALGGVPGGTTNTQEFWAACAPPTPVPTSTPANTPTPADTPTPCGGYSDVTPQDYFYTPVSYLSARGVISGYADCTFRPYANTTRAQQVKIVVLGFGIPIATPTPAGAYTFADVLPAAPFFDVIETAAAASIVSGYVCGGPGEPCDVQHRPYFRPNVDVTRGQLSKIDVVAAGWSLQTPAAPSFADVLPGSAFYSFVETAACHGVISGYACGGPGEPCDAQQRPYFRQYHSATRGQIAKIVYLSITGSAACTTQPESK